MGEFLLQQLATGLFQVIINKCLDKKTYITLFDLLDKAGVKLSAKAQEWKRKLLESYNSEKEEESQTVEIPSEIVTEFTDMLKNIVKIQEMPVYAAGVIFNCEEELPEKIKKDLATILTGDFPVEDEYESIVDNFIGKYFYETYNPKNYFIEDHIIGINLEIERSGAYFQNLCDEKEFREFADAINRMLGHKYIISFSVF